MKITALLYLCTACVLLPVDAIFLGTLGGKIFKSQVGDMIASTPRAGPAILFYVIYVGGILTFVNGSYNTDWQHNLLYGALFGLFCYATFELTNMALLKHWEWGVVVPDIIWGMAVTAIAASAGRLLANWLAQRIF